MIHHIISLICICLASFGVGWGVSIADWGGAFVCAAALSWMLTDEVRDRRKLEGQG